MRFTLNLATKTYIDQRLVNRVVVVSLVLLLALLVWNVSRFARNMGELDRLAAENAAFEGRLNSRPTGVSEKEYNLLLASIRFYNGVIERKAFSWLALLEQLENSTPEGIALSSFAPEKNSGEFKIEGRAKSFANVKSYLEKMEDSHDFKDILLLSHSDVAFGEKSRGVQFTISCRVVMK